MASSYRYGLTEGSLMTRVLSLTPLGKSIVAPLDTTDVGTQLRKALLNNPLFEKAYSHFDGKPLPREDVLKNTFTHAPEMGGLGIPREDVMHFIKIFMQNIKDYDLVQEIRGTSYLRLDKLGKQSTTVTSDSQLEKNEFMNIESISETVSEDYKKNQANKTSRVFISHSKNTRILEQIKQMLKFGGFELEVAIETETTAIPIPEKIFGLMRECNCAVINISADESEKRDDGSYGVNANVLIEIGAAFLCYDKKVILLVDKRVNLPSNLQGLSQIYYEGDELSWNTAMKLSEALTKFKIT